MLLAHTNIMKINIGKLKKELYYHPAWAEDQDVFFRFLRQSSFSDKDIIIFARLYVKYSHIHCFQESQLTYYFNYMLEKMQIYTSKQLFKKTNNIYAKMNTL